MVERRDDLGVWVWERSIKIEGINPSYINEIDHSCFVEPGEPNVL